MPGRHATPSTVTTGMRRLGSAAVTTTAVAGATGAGLAGAAGTALAAPQAEETSGSSSTAVGKEAVAEARKHIGAPYEWGAEGPDAFDCSGLTQHAYEEAGVDLPRTAAQQQDEVESVSQDEMRPGDLIFQGEEAHHVAIYAGNGKMITAPEPGQDVKVDDLPSSYTVGRAG